MSPVLLTLYLTELCMELGAAHQELDTGEVFSRRPSDKPKTGLGISDE